MSAIGDAIKALKDILLIQADVERLEKDVSDTNVKVAGMHDQLVNCRERISRLEGFVAGAERVNSSQRLLGDS